MGLTDLNVIHGVPSFIYKSEEINKPCIIGVNFIIENDSLCLYALDETGYHSLVDLVSINQKEGLTLEVLKSHKQGLLCVLETSSGEFKESFLKLDTKEFAKYLIKFSRIFDDDKFYLGVEVTSKDGVAYANNLRKFANEFTYNLVAFPKIKYVKKEDAIVLKIVEAIDSDTKLSEKALVGQEYFMKESDYQKIYTKKEIENTIEIIKKSNFDFHHKRGEMLHYPCDDSVSFLKEKCLSSLKEKGLGEEYLARLNYELDIITTMGYPDYFLIVSDYVNWAKQHDILVGPGRGSAAGSLVAYLLNITEVDPLEYDLQFERFLNINRSSMPDIDVDFMDTKRDLVVEYMREKYGNDHVANIVTFQTILAKQALRDVGRVYGIPTHHIDLLSKTLTDKDLDLRGSYKKLPNFRSLVDSDKYFLEIVSLASKIEKLPRQSGMHAAGIILNNQPLDGAIPVTLDFSNNYISQYEMDYLEEQGFLKMDFLGLRNLTTIDTCIKLINANHKDANLDFYHIDYDKPETYELISKGLNMGIFQIETQAMARSIKILQPNCFNDIVALLALGRPGPMDYIPSYAKRKNGLEQVSYIIKELEPILKETYGIIVYQEQINKIATVIAGLTPAEADSFRRAVSKKDKDVLVSLEKQFIDGAKKLGHAENDAKKVFDNILKFANYGFNKSHSVVYSKIACIMAYLKATYPLEFYASILLTSSSNNDTKFQEYVSEMKSRGIKLLPPDINKSINRFTISDNSLLFPLNAISGVNDVLVANIIHEREENGEFKTFFDFVIRMFAYKISEVQIKHLIDAGALDYLYSSRESMRYTVLSAMQYATLLTDDGGQLSLGINELMVPPMIVMKDSPLENLNKEYEAIGIMLSSNPLSYKKDLLNEKGAISIKEALETERGTIITAGIVKVKKIIHTKKGEPMAFVKIFDETSEIELTIFPRVFENTSRILDKNNIVLVKGHNEVSKGETNFIVEEVSLLEQEESVGY